MIRLTQIARATTFAALIAGSIALAGPAFADDDALPRGKLVVHPTDFTSARGVGHVKRRLESVARSICLGEQSGQNYWSPTARACYETAMKDGLAQIDSRREQAIREGAVELADSKRGSSPAE